MAEILGDATKYPIFTSNADNATLKTTGAVQQQRVEPGNDERRTYRLEHQQDPG